MFKGEKVIKVHASRNVDEDTYRPHGHPEVKRTRARCRVLAGYEKRNKEICSTCQEHQNLPQKGPLLPHTTPSRPSQIIGTDLFWWNNTNYLLVVDKCSNFPETCRLPNTHSSTVIQHTKSIFARYGIPEVVISDNGPQYASHEYEEFANTWDFRHNTSSAAYPQSNGLAERTVQTVKNLLEKA